MRKLFTTTAIAGLFFCGGSFAQTNTFPSTGSAGIGTITPNASAILEMKSTTQGMLIPKMTQAQRDAIVSPAAGLMIYQTNSTAGFYYFNGTVWTAIGAKANLSNLTSTSINAALIANANNTLNLGSSTRGWKNIYFAGSLYAGSDRIFSADSNLNVFIGATSGTAANFATKNNIGIGYGALTANNEGSHNIGIGIQALTSNTTGEGNTATGTYSLLGNLTGNYNTASGQYSLVSNQSGHYNCAFGYEALSENATSYNTAMGFRALKLNTSGQSNTAVGFLTLQSNTTGNENSAFGERALELVTTGSQNTAVGESALRKLTTANSNTAIGYYAGDSWANGSYCTFLGQNADASGAALFNSTAVGDAATITSSNQVRIGDVGVTSIGGYAGWTNLSDGRFKKNIKQDVPGLQFINKLQPLTYTLDIPALNNFLGNGNSEKNTTINEKAAQAIHTGFIAQDVEKAARELNYDFSGVDKPGNDKTPYGLRYAEFVVPLVKAVQELSAENEQLKLKDSEQQKTNNDLQKQINDLKAMITGNQQQTGMQNVNLNATALLAQNVPNPFRTGTTIYYSLPQSRQGGTSAQIIITSSNGKILLVKDIYGTGKGSLDLDASALASGVYNYSLLVDGKLVDTKQMILQK